MGQDQEKKAPLEVLAEPNAEAKSQSNGAAAQAKAAQIAAQVPAQAQDAPQAPLAQEAPQPPQGEAAPQPPQGAAAPQPPQGAAAPQESQPSQEAIEQAMAALEAAKAIVEQSRHLWGSNDTIFQPPKDRVLLDVTDFSIYTLAMRWQDYPLREFRFVDLHIFFQADAHTRMTHFKIDVDGHVSIRTDPSITWWEIAECVSAQYEWIVQNLHTMQRSYDTVSYLAQKERTFKDDDIIFVWGKPYFLRVQMEASEVGLTRQEPVQLMLGRVPNGTSRYTERFHALARKGYLNPEALRSLPWIIDGCLVLPKHCHWHDTSNLNCHLDYQADLNLYYAEFSAAMDATLTDWQQRQLFSSRFLSDPSREMCRRVYSDYFINFHLGNISPRSGRLQNIGYVVEDILNHVDKGIFSGSIVCEPQRNDYRLDPLLSPEPEKIEELEPKLSFNMRQNLESTVGVRTNVPSAKLPEPPELNYRTLPDKYRLCDLIWQRSMFALPETEVAKKAKQQGLYQNLEGNESSIFTINGEEIDPAYALMAYLPDDPALANADPRQLTYDEVEMLSGGSFISLMTTAYIGKHYQRQSMPYFHRTLVKPGILTLKLRGSKRPSKEYIKQQLELQLDEEMKAVTKHFLEMVEPIYKHNLYRLARELEVQPMAEAEIPLFSRIEIKNMKPLGQCRWAKSVNTLRLNRRLIHYPITVLGAIINHELCHLPFHTHGKEFKRFLYLQSPGADALTDSILNLGILPL